MSEFELKLALKGDLVAFQNRKMKALARGVTRGVKETGDQAKQDLRQMTVRAGWPRRAAFSWRGLMFPERGDSPSAAYLLFTNIPHIIGPHARGQTIKAASGSFLAVPIPGSPAESLRPVREGNKAPSHVAAARKKFGELKFVPGRGRRPAMLVAQSVGFSKTGRLSKRKKTKTGKFRKGTASVPLFFLIKQVRLRKTLSPERVFSKAQQRLERVVRRRVIEELARPD
jgi:Family of unknown function (DUF6441)